MNGSISLCSKPARLLALLLMVLGGTLRAEQPFKVRGALPWHNFLSGPTAWDEPEYERYLDWMKKLHLNLLALHCYTGGAQRYVSYVEPMIRIEYRNVVPEAGFDTSLTSRWGYRPLAVKDFAFGTARLFAAPEGAQAFGSRAAVLARTNEERYQRAQALIRHVVEMAHARGIQVAMGFEFGVYPPELFSVIPQDSFMPANMLPDPTHPASIEILRLTIDDILKAYPGIDWIWLWLQEHETPPGKARPALEQLLDREAKLFGEGLDQRTVFTGVWSLEYIRLAHRYLAARAPKVRLAIGGWGGGSQLPPILRGLDRGLPKDVVFTCLNPSMGLVPQPSFLAEIAKNREVWAIPWLEGDAKLWHLQPRVSLMREQVLLAQKQGLSGVLAIHWRTEEIRTNMEAFARFASAPAQAPTVDEIYREDCLKQFGEPAAGELAPLLARMDTEQWFEPLASPEYFPYDSSWGRLEPGLRARLGQAAEQIDRIAARAAQARHAENLRWLAANLHFTLLLDRVSEALAPADQLKARWLKGEVAADSLEREAAASRRALDSAPVESLFNTYAGRVRSRGELGELSSLNQRLWLHYLELRSFLAGLEKRAVTGE
jgi:hypothetical protein